MNDIILYFCLGWRYILTAKFLWLLYFFCLVQLRLWFFVASLNSYLIYYTDDDKDKSKWYKILPQCVQNPAAMLCKCPQHVSLFSAFPQPLFLIIYNIIFHNFLRNSETMHSLAYKLIYTAVIYVHA